MTLSSEQHSKRVWLIAGLGALALLLFLRNPYVVVHPQFWHEDAIIFLVEQRTEGLAAIIKPYAGYLLIFPRLVAAAAACFAIEFTPLLYLTGAYAAWLWVGGLILTSSLFASVRWAFFAGLAWVAVPHGGEVLLNLTNMQWPLAVGLTLLLAEEPGNRSPATSVAFVVLASLTGPFCLLVGPLALWRLGRVRQSSGGFDLIALVSLTIALLQLAMVVLSSNRMQDPASLNLGHFSLLLSIGFFPELFGTQGEYLSDLTLRLGGTLVGTIGMLWVTWTGIPSAWARRRLLLGAVTIYCGALLYIISMQWGSPRAFAMGQRYLFVPFALFVLALISAWSHCRREHRSQLYALLILSLIGWRSSQNFVAARFWYADWPEACRLLRLGEPAKIQVAPFYYEVTIPPEPTRKS